MKNNFWNSIIQVFSTKIFIYIFTFFSSIYIARLLGPEEKGKLDVAIAMIGIGVQFGNLGIHSSNTYYISKDEKNIYKACGNINIIVSIVIAFVFVINLFYQGDFISKVALWIIPVQLMVLLNENILIASGKIKSYNFLEIMGNLFYPIVTIVFSFFVVVKAQEVFILLSVGYIIICILSIFCVLKITKGKAVYDFQFMKKSIKYGLKAYIACLFSYLVLKADIIMINYLKGSGDTGIYSLAVSLSDVLYMVSSSVGVVAFPELGKLTCMQEKRKLLKEILKKLNIIMFILVIVASLTIVPVIKIAYGKMYYESISVFWVLLPGVWAMSNVTILNNFFASINRIEVPITAVVVGFAGNIIFNIVWITQYGIIGAALASTCSYFIVLLTLGVYLKKELVK